MPNPAGTNQNHFTLQPKYGDVKKQTQLTREAPISGSPIAAQALNTPRRSQRQAASGKRAGGQAQAPPPASPPPPSLAATWQAIAQIPGITPLAAQYAQSALQ